LYQSLSVLNFLDENQPPLVFFGHSYGGIIAYELAQLIYERNSRVIDHLIISSTNNPEVLTRKSLRKSINGTSDKLFHLLSDDNLLEEVIHHGGLPVGVHLDILKHMLPIIRSDYQGLETYTTTNVWSTNSNEFDNTNDLPLSSQRRQYPGRMTILGSDSDPGDVTIPSLSGWKNYSQNPEKDFSITLFPNGSHFYFQDSHLTQLVIDRIREICLHTEPYEV
jgi:surfactin synthase thioesterase subunit